MALLLSVAPWHTVGWGSLVNTRKYRKRLGIRAQKGRRGKRRPGRFMYKVRRGHVVHLYNVVVYP